MKNNWCFSYLMGADENILKLKKAGFKIEKDGEDYRVSFPKKKIESYENYLINNLKAGFWNEYISDEVVFMFKFKDGTIGKFNLNSDNQDTILKLCCEFANTTFESIESMLLGNDFYRENTDFKNINIK